MARKVFDVNSELRLVLDKLLVSTSNPLPVQVMRSAIDGGDATSTYVEIIDGGYA